MGEKVVFCDLVAAQNLGGKDGFVADRHRLAVATSRQIDFMFIVGDSRCTFKPKADDKVVTEKKYRFVNYDKQVVENEFKYEVTK